MTEPETAESRARFAALTTAVERRSNELDSRGDTDAAQRLREDMALWSAVVSGRCRLP